MKSLLEYISEKLVINKNRNNIISISSDRIKINIPEKNVEECAKYIEKEINAQSHGMTADDRNFYVQIKTKDIMQWVCPCEVTKPQYSKIINFTNACYYILYKHNCMKDIEPDTPYVQLVNTIGMLVNNERYTDNDKTDDAVCLVSTDNELHAYWVQHWSKGNALNVEYDFKQIALALIIDLSFQVQSEEISKE